MKRVLASRSYEYNGNMIYWDSSSGYWYIYTEPHGRGRMDFPTEAEAEEYLDDAEPEDELREYKVYYIDNSTDSTTTILVDANDPKDAENVAKRRLGRQCYRILKVQEVYNG